MDQVLISTAAGEGNLLNLKWEGIFHIRPSLWISYARFRFKVFRLSNIDWKEIGCPWQPQNQEMGRDNSGNQSIALSNASESILLIDKHHIRVRENIPLLQIMNDVISNIGS
ncbi:hypothetical protein NPIL_110791 [Nephila pilipes]|uniref:Uncharacterized protein n=1 Tax=Nephila pilipes TaxID=299642 RepID=A0A8X6PT26_NEPPI|nr:hypothetical protein NPIL_110791 [Nephila pilipes]